MPNSFPKQNKLCGQLRIAQLYKEGKRFTAWPLRVTYMPIADTQLPTQVLVWAPKSLFKKAVQRNRLRRLMREAYRLNQDILQAPYLLAFNYMDKEEHPYPVIEKAITKALKKIATQPPTTND
ncbi:MAG: ribonuclease P protein component [Paludibacteraceae bacterium]|nr:ribonuclease P protein component [Paludibacteraceae bacterium]